MKCYYEELGIERDANGSDIKNAYRKQALRWHPDKNPDCLAEAKERFQFIQQAYEVLSDAQERAWYDNHREQILRGKNSSYEENCLDVFQYFTVSCFKGYGDDPKGFYAVYREVFGKIAAEDVEFMDDEEEVGNIPGFGNSESSYDEVVGPFYAYWQAYCTKKTYEWLCPYNVQEIRDRRILREIEKEMKKIVQKAKKERNEEIRNLVSFIRKRDKRVQVYKQMLEERASLNRKKQEQNRLEQIRKRQREVEEMRQTSNHAFNEGYEEQLKQLELQYGGSSDEMGDEEQEEDDSDIGENSDVEDNDYGNDLYCVACNKTFKNENAFANHEASKKHRETVERMKKEMLEEEDALNSEMQEYSNDKADNEDEAKLNEESDLEDLIEDKKYEESDIAEASSEPATGRKSKKSKKSKKTAKSNIPIDAELLEPKEYSEDFLLPSVDDKTSDTEDWNSSSKKSARKNKNKKTNTKPSTESKITAESKPSTASNTIADPADVIVPQMTSIKIGNDLATTNTTHFCATCKSTFASKNKLFAHLKITNHSIYIPKANKMSEQPDSSKDKKGKNKRK